MDLAWLSQIAFKSLGCNPNSNAISVQFLECFLENIDLERKKRERDIFHRLVLIFSLLVAGKDLTKWKQVLQPSSFHFCFQVYYFSWTSFSSQNLTKDVFNKRPLRGQFYFNFLCIHHGGIICIYFYTIIQNLPTGWVP